VRWDAKGGTGRATIREVDLEKGIARVWEKRLGSAADQKRPGGQKRKNNRKENVVVILNEGRGEI